MKHPVQIPKYIQQCIAEGEHQQQDFKMRVDDSKKLARTLAAFANTDGGRLLVGIKDNGNISGVNAEEELHMIEAAAQMYCRPVIPFKPQVWKVDNRSVLEIIVTPSVYKPHQAITDEGDWKPFIRNGDQNLIAPSVLREVWRSEDTERPQKYFHTDKEKMIFETLQAAQEISLNQISKRTTIPRKNLTSILARLIRWGLVEMFFLKEQALFRLK